MSTCHFTNCTNVVPIHGMTCRSAHGSDGDSSGPSVQDFSSPGLEVVARDRGMALAAGKNHDRLAAARAVAVRIAELKGHVCIDDVRIGLCDAETLKSVGAPIEPFVPGNWMGSVFKEPGKWQVVNMVKTTHKRGHARRVFLYTLAQSR